MPEVTLNGGHVPRQGPYVRAAAVNQPRCTDVSVVLSHSQKTGGFTVACDMAMLSFFDTLSLLLVFHFLSALSGGYGCSKYKSLSIVCIIVHSACSTVDF